MPLNDKDYNICIIKTQEFDYEVFFEVDTKNETFKKKSTKAP